jgi:hypothetical protein
MLRLKTIDHLNLLKTDTEGFDLEVITGAKSALSDAQVDMIVAEVGFHPERRHHTYLPDVQSYLLRHEYELYCMLAASIMQTLFLSQDPKALQQSLCRDVCQTC